MNHNGTVAERISKNHNRTAAERISKIGSELVQDCSEFVQDCFGPEQIILVQVWFGSRTVPAGQ